MRYYVILTIDPKKDIINQLTSYNENDSKEKSIMDDIWFAFNKTNITCMYHGRNFYMSISLTSKNRSPSRDTITTSWYFVG